MTSKIQPKSMLLLMLTILLIQSCGESPLPVDLLVTQAEIESVMPAATASPPYTPKPTPASTATPDFIVTNSVKMLVATVQPRVLETHSSPDGSWTVAIVRYDCINYTYEDYRGIIAYEQVKILDLSDGSVKIVADQLQACDGIGTYGFDGLYWSPSARYFYYTDSREGYPGGCGNYIMPAIYRLDTVTQESVLLGGGNLSPDGTKLAMWQGDDIVIWDLDRGEIGRVRSLAPDFFAGEIAWSPDSQSLVYLQTEFDCARDYGISYVIHVNIGKMSQTLLIKYPPPGFGGVDWYSPRQITLQDGDGNYFNYDFFTREKTFLGKTPFTPTPVPPGIFALKFYPPLIMSYDPSVWMDKSRYTDYKFMVNYLQASNLKTCQIGVVGPSGNFPADAKPVWVGKVEYFYSLSEVGTPGMTGALYIENQSLSKFDYTDGLPVLMITASKPEWDRCKVLGEVVLSTLRVP